MPSSANVADITHVSLDLGVGATSGTLDYTGTAQAVAVDLSAHTGTGFDSIQHVANVTGGSGDDTLTGDAGDNHLTGGGGNDTLAGGFGRNVLDGGASTAISPTTVTGGNTADYSAAGSTAVTVNLNTATEQTTGLGNDTLVSIQNLTGGGGNDKLTGDGNANILKGGLGNDTLVGGGGHDLLIGGQGADAVSGGGDGDYFVYNAQNEGGTFAGAGSEDTINGFSVTAGDVFEFKYTSGNSGGFFDQANLGSSFSLNGAVNSAYYVNSHVDGSGNYTGANGHASFVLDTAVGGGNNGTLWFDADGNGSVKDAHDVKIATFDGASNLAGFGDHPSGGVHDLLLI